MPYILAPERHTTTHLPTSSSTSSPFARLNLKESEPNFAQNAIGIYWRRNYHPAQKPILHSRPLPPPLTCPISICLPFISYLGHPPMVPLSSISPLPSPPHCCTMGIKNGRESICTRNAPPQKALGASGFSLIP